MIIDALLTLILAPLDAAVSLLPAASPLGLAEPGSMFVGFAQFNTFMPITEVVAGVGIVLLVELGTFAFRVVVTLWQQLPFT